MALRGSNRGLDRGLGPSSRFDFKAAGPTQTSPQQESVFSEIGRQAAMSEIGSDDGRNGAGYAVGGKTSSSKAQILANEIANIEQRCDFLEERNKWLSEKLLRSQRVFIERTFISSGKVLCKLVYKAWKEAMDLLRLEHQLEQQTESLDQCQQVAKELGQALAREQEVSRKQQDGRRQIEADFEELAQTHTRLKGFSDTQSKQITTLQRQVQTVTQGLETNKREAQSLVDAFDYTQQRIKELKKEDPTESDPKPVSRVIPGGREGLNSSTIEESMKLRDEAQNVMNSMSGLLQQPSAANSPQRVMMDDRRQQQRYEPRTMMPGDMDMQRGMQRGMERSSMGSRGMVRTPSPMEGRFQSVTNIVDNLEAPSVISTEMPWARGNEYSSSNALIQQSRDLLARGTVGERSPIFGRQSNALTAGRR